MLIVNTLFQAPHKERCVSPPSSFSGSAVCAFLLPLNQSIPLVAGPVSVALPCVSIFLEVQPPLIKLFAKSTTERVLVLNKQKTHMMMCAQI